MNKNKSYQTPMVLKEVSVLFERDFLEGSIVDESVLMYSDGQEVVEVDSQSTEFDWNNDWTWE